MANPLFDRLIAPLSGQARPFLYLPDGETITAGDFFTLAAQAANALQHFGLTTGDRVAVQAAKTPAMLALYAGAAAAGVVFLPLNPAYTPAELDHFLGDSGARLFLCDPERAGGLAGLADRHGARIETLGPGGTFDACATRQPGTVTAADRAPGDLATLLYTSGTTGRSKGAMLTQDNLLSNALVLAKAWQFGPDDILLHALPIFHVHGLFVATNTVLASGGAMIFQPGFDRTAVIDALPQATTMMGVPTFYTRLLDDPRLTGDLVGHVRLFVSGSAPMSPETHRAWTARTGHQVLERYGMTETGMIASNPYSGERRPGSVGPALPGVELRVSDPGDGTPLPPGKVGMVEVRGPNVFAGYWRMPERTAAELRTDGFFITGDMGRLDGDGYLMLVGRQKDVVIAGGLNIYPAEVEALLDAAPGVRESAVIGLPHPDLGEAVLAVLAPEPGAAPDTQAIAASLIDRLARFKQPRGYVVLDTLPRNSMGKIQKAALRDRFADWFTAAG